MRPLPIRVTVRSTNQEISMLGRIVAVTLAFGGLMTSSAALAQRDPTAAVVQGVITGAAIATGAVVPYEHREPLREYVVRENRPSYRYEDEVVVGRELRSGSYEFLSGARALRRARTPLCDRQQSHRGIPSPDAPGRPHLRITFDRGWKRRPPSRSPSTRCFRAGSFWLSAPSPVFWRRRSGFPTSRCF